MKHAPVWTRCIKGGGLIFLLALQSALFSQTNVALRSKVTFPGQVLANIWGYAAGGKEYALVGAFSGMIVVDVTDPDNPVQIVQIPGPNSEWREIKTYSHYAYVVSEGGFGLQIVDLSNLPNSNLNYKSYYGDGAILNSLTRAHALHIDEAKGYAFLYGSNLFSGQPIFINLNADPYNPTYAGYFNQIGYAHDGYVYNDMMYSAHIFAGQFAIVDVSNKSNPVLLGTQTTPGAFTHNTWRNGNTLFTTDEISGSFLTAYDITSPSAITQLDKIQSNPGSGSIVHNTHIFNDYAITSWYRDGFTITDVSRPSNLVQVGNYDTYPASGNGFNGCWGVYPYLPSGNIVASNIKAQGAGNIGELWVFTPTYTRACFLEGVITNASNGQLLNGAKIQIISPPNSETSGANGQYKMGQVQNGTFTVQVSKAGFQNFTTTVTLINGVVTILDVALQPAPLPVEWTRFSARLDGRDGLLEWETASEVNNKGFDIQHSRNGVQWTTLGFVPSKGSQQVPAQYDFRAPELSPGTHFFRLRQMDFDGKDTYSEWRSVQVSGGALFVEMYPTLVDADGQVRIVVEKNTTLTLEIWNAALQPTGVRQTIDVENERIVPISVAGFSPGTYYLVVQNEQERKVLPFGKR